MCAHHNHINILVSRHIDNDLKRDTLDDRRLSLEPFLMRTIQPSSHLKR
jgi:hypothetical protein